MTSIGSASTRVVTDIEWNRSREATEGFLASWVQNTYSVGLDSVQHEDFSVEWLVSSPAATEYSCSLSVLDRHAGSRLSVALIDNPDETVLFFEEDLLQGEDVQSAAALSSMATSILTGLIGVSGREYSGLDRLKFNETGDKFDPGRLASVLQGELSPGLILLVVDEGAEPSGRQRELAGALLGIAIVLVVTQENAVNIGVELGVGDDFRPGSVVSLARSGSRSIDVETVGAFSLQRQSSGALRLLLRHQLAAPTPFALDQRKNAALRRMRDQGSSSDVGAAEELLDEEARRASELEQRLDELKLELDRAWDEQDTVLRQLDSTQSRNKFLERALRTSGSMPVEVESVEEWMPDTCSEALAAANDEFDYLVISALDDPADELDRHARRAIWAKKIWMALRGLNDYARAKAEGAFADGLHRYQQDPPAGSISIQSEYASKESKSTSNEPDMRSARTFRVPSSVSPDGMCYMGAHLKIDLGGPVAPRIHFFDDSSGATQRVYVGYIGRHLRTSSGF